MEILKEFFSTAGGRLRSHFFGSILLSLLVFNWKPVLYLLYSNVPILAKFTYMENNTVLATPIVVGILIAILSPWVTAAGASLAQKPVEMVVTMQDRAKHARAIKLLAFESDENQKKAELAKSVDDALKSIEDDDIRDKLREDSISDRSDKSEFDLVPNISTSIDALAIIEALSPLEITIIKRLAKPKGALLTVIENETISSILIDGQPVPNNPIDEYKTSIANLKSLDLIRSRIAHTTMVAVYELTDSGQEISWLIPTPPSN